MDQAINATPDTQDPRQTTETTSLRWHNTPGLASFCILVFFLQIITLRIYSFWAKNDTRKYIWNCIHLEGQPLQYTGRGLELFVGYLLASMVIGFPLTLYLMGMGFAMQAVPTVGIGMFVFFYLILTMLMGVAQYRARRYRLSRTMWRGIRGTMTGSSIQYGLHVLWTTLLIPFTLGWIIPWQSNMLQRRLTNETQFGNQLMSYDGSSSKLYGRFAIVWSILFVLGAIFMALNVYAVVNSPSPTGMINPAYQPYVVILGIFIYVAMIIGFFWFQIDTMRHFAASTSYDGMKFHLSATTPGFIGTMFVNLVLFIFTLGIAYPAIQARTVKYFVERLTLIGTIDFEKITQNTALQSGLGEGLAQAYDVDMF